MFDSRWYGVYAVPFLATMVVFTAANIGYELMPADMNLFSHIVIGAAVRCDGRMLRRNGYLYSHMNAFERISNDKDLSGKLYHYPDDINCTLNICSGLNSRILVQFPRRIRLACSTDGSTCDCLNVHDGSTIKSPLLRSYCGSSELDKLKPFESSGPDLTFHFRTDKNCRNEEGFQLQFSAFRRGIAQPKQKDGPAGIPGGKSPLAFGDPNAPTNPGGPVSHVDPQDTHEGLPRPGYPVNPATKDWCDAGEEFACDLHRCVPLCFLCDDVYQCLDKTDEGGTGCSSDERFCKRVLEIRPYFGYIIAIAVLLLLILVVGIVGLCWCIKRQNWMCGENSSFAQWVLVLAGRDNCICPLSPPDFVSGQKPNKPGVAPGQRHRPSDVARGQNNGSSVARGQNNGPSVGPGNNDRPSDVTPGQNNNVGWYVAPGQNLRPPPRKNQNQPDPRIAPGQNRRPSDNATGQGSGYEPVPEAGYAPGQASNYVSGSGPNYVSGQGPNYVPGQGSGYEPVQEADYAPGQRPSYVSGIGPNYVSGQESNCVPGQGSGNACEKGLTAGVHAPTQKLQSSDPSSEQEMPRYDQCMLVCTRRMPVDKSGDLPGVVFNHA